MRCRHHLAHLRTNLCELEKEGAAVTFKKGFGYHPLGVWCDNTQESMALMLRPGNAGSNTAADHIAVLTAAIAQVPATHRKKLLIRADGAGASHELLAWITGLDAKRVRSVEYSVGYAVNQHVRDAIARVPKTAWKPAITAAGERREHGDVVEITGMLNLKKWPAGMRVIIRREHPPGASLTLFEHADGWRYQAVATNTPLATGGQVAFLEARHRAHARVETRIRHAKDSGIGRFPSREYDINSAWAMAASISADLIAWLRLLALPPGLKACEPKALRYRFLQVPARLTHSSRRRHLRFPRTWPWAKRDRRRIHRHPRTHRDPRADLRPRPSSTHDRARPGEPPRSATRPSNMPTDPTQPDISQTRPQPPCQPTS